MHHECSGFIMARAFQIIIKTKFSTDFYAETQRKRAWFSDYTWLSHLWIERRRIVHVTQQEQRP